MRRWIWFAGLYLAGIAVIGMIAYLIRSVLI
ncbi:MAG: DUF2474 domain-containing protein [Paracoccaceae bacterium]